MSAQFAHAPHRGGVPAQQVNYPHAALLIDFDNVTMGIRSDLSKELKNLLSSAIIKGKVAVQRAYADWRRYPQYIVPLAESSVDLIFAPAYGSSKKNATDIRLAIDALELVFTRPEIGTFILLSGDSDFSSLVLKLKEYGKYVIGVGIRESASDLLVQNCDEYYSYSALTGLTRAGDEPRGSMAAQDPWELVEIAVRQMVENNDVMRSDRLKQVMLEMDPSFDEKALGFQKFNRFMQDAAQRGMVSLKKLENGQFEIGAALPGARADAEEDEQRGNGRARRSRRGGRGRGRERSQPELSITGDDGLADPTFVAAGDGMDDDDADEAGDAFAAMPAAVTTPVMPMDEYEAPAAAVAHTAPAHDESADAGEAADAIAPDTMDVAEIVAENTGDSGSRGRSRRGRGGRGRGRDSENGAEVRTRSETPTPRADQEPRSAGGRDEGLPPLETSARTRGDSTQLREAYSLLRTAAKDVMGRSGGTARDSDVKRRMLELQPEWDEGPLGFSKFSRFLRQAHDAEVINLHKSDTGYDVTLGDGIAAIAKDPSQRTGRTGRSSTGREEGVPPAAQTALFAGGERSDAGDRVEAPMGSQVTHAAPAERTAQPARQAPSTSTQARPAAGVGAAPTMGPRRGSRGRPLGGPPPLLEGQTFAPMSVAPESAPSQAASSQSGSSQASAPAASSQPATSQSSARKTAAPPPVREPKNAQFAALGFPTDAASIAAYLAEYKGVGPKSIQTLIDTFGATNVFDALQNKPDRVREVVTGARAETLLDAWGDDYTLRKANATPPEKQKASAAPEKRATAKKGPARRGGPAKGGRGDAPRGGGRAGGGARTGGRSGPARKPTKRA